MRSTHTKATDYDKMLKFIQSAVGCTTLSVIQQYASKHKIVSHRASKVFWGLVDEGSITCVKEHGVYTITRVVAQRDNAVREEE